MRGRLVLPGPARNAPGTSIRIGEKRVSVLIATTGGAVNRPVVSWSGDDLIQPEKSHQENSHQGDRNQEVPPAGLQNGFLHLRLQDFAVFVSLIDLYIAKN